jgi:nucleotide-binding universal stress UspA family protein
MEKIVVGVDASAGAQRAVEWALEEAAVRGARVVLVHSVESPRLYYYPDGLMTFEMEEGLTRQALEEAGELLDEVLRKAGGAPDGVRVETETAVGSPPGVLVQEGQDAELLVVGSRGRGGFRGLLLGSVSQQVVNHAPCPVVVIPPEGRAASS